MLEQMSRWINEMDRRDPETQTTAANAQASRGNPSSEVPISARLSIAKKHLTSHLSEITTLITAPDSSIIMIK